VNFNGDSLLNLQDRNQLAQDIRRLVAAHLLYVKRLTTLKPFLTFNKATVNHQIINRHLLLYILSTMTELHLRVIDMISTAAVYIIMS